MPQCVLIHLVTMLVKCLQMYNKMYTHYSYSFWTVTYHKKKGKSKIKINVQNLKQKHKPNYTSTEHILVQCFTLVKLPHRALDGVILMQFNLTMKEKKRKGVMRNIAGGFRWNHLPYSPSVIKKHLLNYAVALGHIQQNYNSRM